jgi:hypothetical protein
LQFANYEKLGKTTQNSRKSSEAKKSEKRSKNESTQKPKNAGFFVAMNFLMLFGIVLVVKLLPHDDF